MFEFTIKIGSIKVPSTQGSASGAKTKVPFTKQPVRSPGSHLGTFTRRGVISSETGLGLEEVLVDVYNVSTGELVFQTVTDQFGKYQAGGFEPGTYEFWLYHSSFGVASFVARFDLPQQPDVV